MTVGSSARIGPNAILQLVPVLDECLGEARRRMLLKTSGIDRLPDGSSMVDEAPVARLHQALRRHAPQDAKEISRRAGLATGDYILRHRIPGPAKRILALLPRFSSSRLLAKAIARHAWTFAGSGQFRIVSMSPLVFEIADNPVVRGESGHEPLCAWHAAVFERLYRVLVHDRYRAREIECSAQGFPTCRFLVELNQDACGL